VLAYAQAKLGNFSGAEANIAATPADCYDCLISRSRIAEIEGQHARADWWFDRAVKSNPSIPFAYAEWGEALLERGQSDAAIAKFTLANQKGPHFADPLEMWGEALMAKNRSDQALAKFEEAEKYAPNWGRLHLKWGEALGYVGRKDEAQKQFALAAGLDLSNDDKAELARVSHG
jgi:tetratricopeptide (TPR) repeat protein